MTQDFEPQGPEGSGSPLGGRPPLAIIGAIIAVVVVGIAVVAALALGGGGDDNNTDDRPASVSSPASSGGLVTPALPTPAGTPLAQGDTLENAPNLTSVGAGDRLVISKINVNAPLSYKTVGADGVMPNPNGSDDVAYYNFAAWPGKGGAPGQGGNSVFAGHVDSGRVACKNGTVPPPCEAVFWDVGKLAIGDEIQVVVGSNTFRYRVSSNAPVNAETGDWDSIVSARAQETITLITCGGDFNPTTREYSHRQVVVATRIT
jgi:LPXTG-site transpeptidase (sortase) family protein